MIYIGTDEGIYRWFSRGGWPTFHGLQERGIVAMAAGGAGVLGAIDDKGRLVETTDGGLNWREIPPPEGSGRATALAISGGAGGWLLATARPFGLYRRPVGLAVEPVGAGRGPLAFARRYMPMLNFLGEGGTATIEARPGARARTVGDPLGWERLGDPEFSGVAGGAPVEVRALIEVGPAGLFASESGAGLWRSGDLGKTWDRAGGLPDQVYLVKAADPTGTRLLAGTSDGVWASDDGGSNWSQAGSGFGDSGQVRALSIRPGDPKTILAGASPRRLDEAGAIERRGGTSRYALFESKDGGGTWKHVVRGFPELLEYDQIVEIRHDPADPDCAVAALATGELWYTHANGLWWEPLARQMGAARALAEAP